MAGSCSLLSPRSLLLLLLGVLTIINSSKQKQRILEVASFRWQEPPNVIHFSVCAVGIAEEVLGKWAAVIVCSCLA